jgi:hypothetical protein
MMEAFKAAPQEPIVCPWEAKPYQLWSLLDMLRFYAISFAAAVAEVNRATTAFSASDVVAVGAPTFQRELKNKFTGSLEALKKHCGGLPLSRTYVDKVDRTLDRCKQEWPVVSVDVLVALAQELQNDLLNELSGHYFLMIPTGHRRELYEQKGPPFGNLVAERFPDADSDIRAAARCLALDEWTAAVFHSMRVLEYGLRFVATRFGVSFATDSWHAVIRGIEDGIDAVRNKGRATLTDQDRADITFYSDVATEFRHFKDAWRNHVSHSRKTYTNHDAPPIFQHVGTFMEKLASHDPARAADPL